MPFPCCPAVRAAAQVEIDSVEKFEALRAAERAYFDDMVQRCKDAGATLVICQWGEAAPRAGVLSFFLAGLLAVFRSGLWP